MTPTPQLQSDLAPEQQQGVTCERHLSGRKAVYAAIGTAVFLIALALAGYFYLHAN